MPLLTLLLLRLLLLLLVVLLMLLFHLVLAIRLLDALRWTWPGQHPSIGRNEEKRAGM